MTTPTQAAMTKLEEVAWAIAPKVWATYGKIGIDTPTNRNRRTASLRHARAAVEALREPSDAMMAATKEAFAEVEAIVGFNTARMGGTGLTWKDDKPPIWHAWNAMLDAILSEPQP